MTHEWHNRMDNRQRGKRRLYEYSEECRRCPEMRLTLAGGLRAVSAPGQGYIAEETAPPCAGGTA